MEAIFYWFCFLLTNKIKDVFFTQSKKKQTHLFLQVFLLLSYKITNIKKIENTSNLCLGFFIFCFLLLFTSSNRIKTANTNVPPLLKLKKFVYFYAFHAQISIHRLHKKDGKNEK